MLYGIGCDLCEIARLARSLDGAHGETFLRRVYGPQERAALGALGGAHRAASAAADFAAKEAFLKAAHTGLDGSFALDEIEAVRLPSGAPAYRFAGRAAAWMQEHRLVAHLSLSHENGMALAFCVLETLPQ
jgi:holo-[acyl-carrier protein] synthase